MDGFTVPIFAVDFLIIYTYFVSAIMLDGGIIPKKQCMIGVFTYD